MTSDGAVTQPADVAGLIERLRVLRARATPGEWQLQDGCSWRRIGTREHDGNVLHPDTYSRADRHPDLSAGQGEDLYANLRLIVAAVNALPSLLAHHEAQERWIAEALDMISELLRLIRVPVDGSDQGYLTAAMERARALLNPIKDNPDAQ